MTGRKWGAWLNVIVGALLVLAPFLFGYHSLSDIATNEAIAVGLVIGVCALWAALSMAAPAYLDYVVAAVGGWSIAAPFVLGYHNSIEVARNTDVAIGIVAVLVVLIGHFYVSPVVRRKLTA